MTVVLSISLKQKHPKTMKAITKTAFFFMAMIALTTACSKKAEKMTSDDTSAPSADSSNASTSTTMATDSATTELPDSVGSNR